MVGDIAAALDSKLEITFSAEAYASAGKRMFVRALVDGQAANPSDVVFAEEGFTGTCSFTFTKENVAVGAHSVQIQWLVDAGGTAYVGDRTLTLNHWQSQVPDLSKPFYSLKPVIGKRKVLVILWDPHRPEHPAPAKSAVENLIFGPNPSVRDYFLENSGGRFMIEKAGVLGWYDADKPADHYWNHPAACCEDGFLGGHTEKWAESVRKADNEFNFKSYDTNNDNYLSAAELGIVIVIPQNTPFGTKNYALGRQCPEQEHLIVDGVRVNIIAEIYIGSPPHLGVVAHELAHVILVAGDMYFWFFQPYAAGAYSVMDDAPPAPPHLDPFHKLRLGWIPPKVVNMDGCYKIRDIETHNEAYILCDRAQGNKEYYIVENRWPATSYDSTLPDVGLGVWHIMEDPAVFGALPAPAGSPPAEWAKVQPHDWARRGIRMIRPVYGPPFNDALALWEGSDPVTGYDLLPVDPDPNHVELRWIEGSPTKFAIKNFPVASPQMKVYIDASNPSLVGDLYPDCWVNFFDFAILANDWLNVFDWVDVAAIADHWLETTDPDMCP
jgi:M6 family metalloprotease-like protein